MIEPDADGEEFESSADGVSGVDNGWADSLVEFESSADAFEDESFSFSHFELGNTVGDGLTELGFMWRVCWECSPVNNMIN